MRVTYESNPRPKTQKSKLHLVLKNGRYRKSETPSALVGSMRQMEAGRLDDGKLDAVEPGGAQDTAGERASLLEPSPYAWIVLTTARQRYGARPVAVAP